VVAGDSTGVCQVSSVRGNPGPLLGSRYAANESMPNALSPAWELLESYESRDVVSRLYAEVHGREPGAEKAREMTSALTQAR
jgi:hypothetical protein